VNGVPLHEQSYLYPGSAPSTSHFNITVPAGRLWVMGDNRLISDDSRGHMLDPGRGTIPENMVIGRAFAVVWPPSRWRILPIPATFSQPGITGQAERVGSAGSSRQGSTAAASSRQEAMRASSAWLGARIRLRPAAPWLPLTAGFIIAAPLTALGRRAMRFRVLRSAAGRRRQRSR
jgi:hypothetical protein